MHPLGGSSSCGEGGGAHIYPVEEEGGEQDRESDTG